MDWQSKISMLFGLGSLIFGLVAPSLGVGLPYPLKLIFLGLSLLLLSSPFLRNIAPMWLFAGMMIGLFLFAGCGIALFLQPAQNAVVAAENSLQPSFSEPALTPPQQKLLELIAENQRNFAATKLIIGRNGALVFDYEPGKSKFDFVAALYGANDAKHQDDFANLMESLPTEYLRFFPEMRWDSPFVVAITEKGIKYLRGTKT